MAKRRESRYPIRLTTLVPAHMATRIRAASDRYAVAESVIVRRAIKSGLRLAIESVRKEAEAADARVAEEE